MEQTFLAGQDLYKGAECHNGNNFAVIYLTNFRNSADALDNFHGSLDGLLVGSGHFDKPDTVFLLDGDDGMSPELDLLNDFATCTDNRADEFLRNRHRLDSRDVRFVVLTRSRHGLQHLVEDVHPAAVCLRKCIFENLVGEPVNLDVHLAGGDPVAGTGYLEVHVAKVILVAENIGQNLVFLVFPDNQTHGNSGDRFFHLDAGIHQRQGSGTNGGHR